MSGFSSNKVEVISSQLLRSPLCPWKLLQKIYIPDDHWYVLYVVLKIHFFPCSWIITRYDLSPDFQIEQHVECHYRNRTCLHIRSTWVLCGRCSFSIGDCLSFYLLLLSYSFGILYLLLLVTPLVSYIYYFLVTSLVSYIYYFLVTPLVSYIYYFLATPLISYIYYFLVTPLVSYIYYFLVTPLVSYIYYS